VPRAIAGAGAAYLHSIYLYSGIAFRSSANGSGNCHFNNKGESHLPYDNQQGPRAFCPRSANPLSHRSPRRAPRETNMLVQLRRARMAGVCRHWRLAKRLSPSLTKKDMEGWFIAAPEHLRQPTTTPSLWQLHWLIKLRTEFKKSGNRAAHLRIDAAICIVSRHIKAATYSGHHKKIPKALN